METIIQILDKTGKVSIDDLRTAVKVIIDTPEIVQEFKAPDGGGNFLHYLARLPRERQWEVLPLFYLAANKGVDLNEQDHKDNTPLHLVASGGHPKAVLALQRLGATPYLTNDIGKVPMMCIQDDQQLAQYKRFYPTLQDAVEKGDVEGVESRLEGWCFPVGKTPEGEGEVQSLVDLAKDNSKDEVVPIIEMYEETLNFIQHLLAGDIAEAQKSLEAGGLDDINVNIQDVACRGDHSLRPLVLTVIEDVRLPEVVEYVVSKGVDLSVYLDTFFPPGPLYFITEYSDPKLPEDLSLAVLTKADLSLKNYRARTILYEAQTRSPDYAKKVLKLGVDISERDFEGHTVVDNVLFNGMFHLLPAYYEHLINLMKSENGLANMERLVLNSYDYIANTVDGFDALKIAQEKKLTEVAAYLEKAPQLLMRIKSMHESITAGNPEGAKTLLDDKLALARDKGGRNVLHLAVLHAQRQFGEYLIYQYPAAITGRDNYRRTPLHYAAASGDMHMYHALVKAGADDSLKDCHNLSPADYLVELEKKDLTADQRADAAKREVFLVKGMMEREKAARYGLKVYLKLQYDSLKKKIEDEDVVGAKALIDAFEASVDDFVEVKITDKPLLFTCLEHRAEEIAIHLINKGANAQVVWVNGRDTLGFVESVYKAELKSLYNTLIEKLGLNARPWSASSQSSYSSSQVQMPSKSRGVEPKKRFQTYPTRLDAKYLANHLGQCLTQALSEVSERRPWDPIEYLAQWLYKHAENAKDEAEAREDAYILEYEKAESQKDNIRSKRQVKEADKIRRDEAELRRQRREAEARERKRVEEEERRLRELEELQKKQREGAEPYSQAPDLATVAEEELAQQEMDTRRLSLKTGSLPQSTEGAPPPPPPPAATSEDIQEEPGETMEDPPAE